MPRKHGNNNPSKVIDRWLERDLTADAQGGSLAPAFEVDSVIDQIVELLIAGRCPILTGESGVGKTAIVHELARRSLAGRLSAPLNDKRFLQFSLRRRAAGLRKMEELPAEMQALVEALAQAPEDMVCFFSDMHVAYRFDLEPLFVALALRFPGMLIAEGNAATIQAMFENTPELDPYYFVVRVEEPSLERVGRIMRAWSREQAAAREVEFAPEALEQAMQLAHRFQARSRQPRKTLDLLGQLTALARPGMRITQADVIERFCATHKTPRALIDPDMPLDMAELEKGFRRQVLGQPEAVRCMVSMISRIKAGLSDARRPFGVFLFAGPTGVGKTHVGQLLAEYLFGSRDHMVRLNMADYSAEGADRVLFGNPEGYYPAQVRGVLTQRLMGQPFAVVLLDEFEKAHARVHDRFLQLIDEGSFINAAGESISCRSTIIIATTNAGAEVYRGSAFGFNTLPESQSREQELHRRLEHHFRLEFLNRFDQIVHFRPLDREAIRMIALRELDRLEARSGLRQRELRLEIDDAVLDWLTVNGYDPDYGARFLRRTIERNVTTVLADAIVNARPGRGSRVELTVRGNRIAARVHSPDDVPSTKEVVTLPMGTAGKARVLDREGLMEEAGRLLEAAAEKFARLEQNKADRSRLLEQMNEPGFWDSSAARAEILDRFRKLDVAIQVEDRLADLLRRVEKFTEPWDGDRIDLNHAARAVEAAAWALREWDERLSEEGAAAAWVVISNVDPLRPAGQCIQDLAGIEMAWCRRVGLDAAVIAYEIVGESLSRAVLSVEGPGIDTYFSMESGLHRFDQHPESDARIRLEVVPRSEPSPPPWPEVVTIRPRDGLLGLRVNARARMELPSRGTAVQMLGEAGDVLSHLMHDLHAAWNQAPAEHPDTARVYGKSGRGAYDPRTDVAVRRLKDVAKGRLDVFLEGWRQRRSRANAELQTGSGR